MKPCDHGEIPVEVRRSLPTDDDVIIPVALRLMIPERCPEILYFSSFKLQSQKTFHLQISESGEMTLPERNLLRIVPIRMDRGKSRIDISIVKDKRDVFHTVVESVDGGVTTIGGPNTNDGIILLRVATYRSG